MNYLKAFLILLLFWASYSHLTPTLCTLRVNIEKYTQRNIPKNEGFHRELLKLIKRATILLPRYNNAEFKRSKNDVGVGNFVNTTIPTKSKQVFVNSIEEITEAIVNSQAGTTINILPGTYSFSGSYLEFKGKGKKEQPIILRADTLGRVIFKMNLYEGFLITSPYIIIENIVFQGVRASSHPIEHALHISGDADHIKINHNVFINFNAHIKSNGRVSNNGRKQFPDHVTIQNNNFYNEWKRDTLSPVSPIDVVGGDNWIIKNNFIADFGKNGKNGEGTTYGLFLKGGSAKGVIENNVIACEWQLPHTSANDVRIEDRPCPVSRSNC